MSKPITISQLHASPADTYVNGELTVWVGATYPPKGNGPAKAKLTDSSGEISASIWGGDISHLSGKQVTLSGKGMKITEYKGTKQLSVGDKVVIGSAADHMPGDPNPAHASPAPQVRPQVTPQASNGHQGQINGATVGMAVKAAVDIYLSGKPLDGGLIKHTAQRIIEICGMLERGETEDVPF